MNIYWFSIDPFILINICPYLDIFSSFTQLILSASFSVLMCPSSGSVRYFFWLKFLKGFVFFSPGLRLLGIGRNQYIDLMNQCRSSKVRAFSSTTYCFEINILCFEFLPFFIQIICRSNCCHNTLLNLYFSCSQKFFRRRPVKELLPGQPIEEVSIEPWWVAQVGYITEDDIRVRPLWLKWSVFLSF